MTDRAVRPLPAALFGLTVCIEAAAIPLSWGLVPVYDLLYSVYAIVMAGAGALIASRQPRNAVGWLFCGFALMTAVTNDFAQGWGLRAAAEHWPGSDLGQWVTACDWLPSGFGWTATFLLFPDGRLSGRFRRTVFWSAAAGMVLSLTGWALSPDRGRDFVSGHSPYAVDWPPLRVMLVVGIVLTLSMLVSSVIGLAVRFRRSTGTLRQQMKWFAFAGGLAAAALPLSFALWYVTPYADLLSAVALTALPVSACVAILGYRLYDIDVVISRTLSYAVLTLTLGTAYLVTTLILGTTLGSGSAWVTACATLVAAMAFRPLRVRIQDAVDRYFDRARYDAIHRMTDFLEALRSGHAAPEEVQELLRATLRDPTLELLVYLPESRITVDLDGTPRPGSWADTETGPSAPDAPDDRGVIAVARGGTPLGVVLLDAAVAGAPDLRSRVVEAGGLAIEIVRLRVELRRQLAEVQASRARIVAAGDAERRRIERDLHDGAQQRLVSIGLALRHAQHLLRSDTPARADAGLDEAVGQVTATIEELRELARGLPPALLDAGLAPAFRDLARRAPFPVAVEMPPGRFPTGVETAAYFVGCEGVTNAVKHAAATKMVLRAVHEDGDSSCR